MALFGRIDNNVVVELFREPEGFTIDECFHPIVRAMFKQLNMAGHGNPPPKRQEKKTTPPTKKK